VLYCATLPPGERGEAERQRLRYEYVSIAQHICLAVERQLTNCLPILPNGATLCHTTYVAETHAMTPRQKLKDVTFTIHDKPMQQLLWCDKLGKGKRHKAAKINGVLVGEPEVFHEL